MNFNVKIVHLDYFKGNKIKIYSVIIDRNKKNLFEIFSNNYINEYQKEVREIIVEVDAVSKVGLHDLRFLGQRRFEGRKSEEIYAFRDKKSKLRLYYLAFGSQAIIIGDGGPKPQRIRKLQEDEHLKFTNDQLSYIYRSIDEKIRDGEIYFDQDGYLNGDIEFYINDEL